MPVLSSDLVCKCPNFERSRYEFGSYRWNPNIIKDNTEGSLSDPVTTDSCIDEIEVIHNTLSNADSFLLFKKDESIVYPYGNIRIGENVKKKSCLLKVTSLIALMN